MNLGRGDVYSPKFFKAAGPEFEAKQTKLQSAKLKKGTAKLNSGLKPQGFNRSSLDSRQNSRPPTSREHVLMRGSGHKCNIQPHSIRKREAIVGNFSERNNSHMNAITHHLSQNAVDLLGKVQQQKNAIPCYGTESMYPWQNVEAPIVRLSNDDVVPVPHIVKLVKSTFGTWINHHYPPLNDNFNKNVTRATMSSTEKHGIFMSTLNELQDLHFTNSRSKSKQFKASPYKKRSQLVNDLMSEENGAPNHDPASAQIEEEELDEETDVPANTTSDAFIIRIPDISKSGKRNQGNAIIRFYLLNQHGRTTL
jgi:hypothetical protein